MVNKSKYYYDYTRNMSVEQELNGCCKNEKCEKENCLCNKVKKQKEDEAFFEAWMESLSQIETNNICNLDNPDCENCGS